MKRLNRILPFDVYSVDALAPMYKSLKYTMEFLATVEHNLVIATQFQDSENVLYNLDMLNCLEHFHQKYMSSRSNYVFGDISQIQADDGLGGLLLSSDGIDLTSAYLLESLG